MAAREEKTPHSPRRGAEFHRKEDAMKGRPADPIDGSMQLKTIRNRSAGGLRKFS